MVTSVKGLKVDKGPSCFPDLKIPLRFGPEQMGTRRSSAVEPLGVFSSEAPAGGRDLVPRSDCGVVSGFQDGKRPLCSSRVFWVTRESHSSLYTVTLGHSAPSSSARSTGRLWAGGGSGAPPRPAPARFPSRRPGSPAAAAFLAT